MRDAKKRSLFALLVVAIMLFVAACGAETETKVEIDSVEKGKRTIAAVVPLEDDLNEGRIDGDADDIDAVFKEHQPDEMTYEGYEGPSGDGETTFTFTMEWNSLDELREKVSKLLEQAPPGTTAEDELHYYDMGDTPLFEGPLLMEYFTSSDLLGWASAALVEEGIIAADDRSASIIAGDSTVFAGGEDITNEDAAGKVLLQHKPSKDYGYEDVTVGIEILPNGSFKNNIYVGDILRNRSGEAQTAAEEYLEAAVPEGGQVETPDSMEAFGGDHVIRFDAADIDELNQKMRQVFFSEDVTFSLEQTKNEDAPSSLVQQFSLDIDCSQVCSSDTTGSGAGPSLQVKTPNNWELLTTGNDIYASGNQLNASSKIGETVTLDYKTGLPIKSVLSTTDLGADGSISQTIDYTFDVPEGFSIENFEETVAPSEEIATTSSSEGDDGEATISVLFEGENAGHFLEKFREYSPRAQFRYEGPNGFDLNPSYNVDMYLNLQRAVLDGGATDGFTQVVNIPAGHSFNQETQDRYGDAISGNTLTLDITEPDGEDITFGGGGMNPIIYWLIGGFVLLAAAAIGFALWFRKKRDSQPPAGPAQPQYAPAHPGGPQA